MNGQKRYWLPVVAVLVLSIGACSSDDQVGPSGSDNSHLITVVGDVIEIENFVPVDGGVTIKLRRDDRTEVVLFYSSLFTNPPPSQEHIDLYQVIIQVDVGERIRAKGRRTDRGIELKDLVILE